MNFYVLVCLPLLVQASLACVAEGLTAISRRLIGMKPTRHGVALLPYARRTVKILVRKMLVPLVPICSNHTLEQKVGSAAIPVTQQQTLPFARGQYQSSWNKPNCIT